MSLLNVTDLCYVSVIALRLQETAKKEQLCKAYEQEENTPQEENKELLSDIKPVVCLIFKLI